MGRRGAGPGRGYYYSKVFRETDPSPKVYQFPKSKDSNRATFGDISYKKVEIPYLVNIRDRLTIFIMQFSLYHTDDLLVDLNNAIDPIQLNVFILF